MAVDFRCENCGKLLSVDGQPDGTIKCPHCAKNVTIPSALASLPQPHVPPNATPSTRQADAQQSAQDDQQSEEDALHAEGGLGVMGYVMPWVVSLFFHVGLGFILMFITLIAGAKPIKGLTVPDINLSEDPGGVMVPQEQTRDQQKSSVTEHTRRERVQDSGMTNKRVAISVAGGGAASGSLGLKSGGPRGLRSSMFGSGGRAYHVVFVIDRSGSMLDSFDAVLQAITNSIQKLKPSQTFHVLFYVNGKPLENDPQQLVPATDEYKEEAAKFLGTVSARGNPTEPSQALARAFDVLAKMNDSKRPGKLIYLLTDGVFSDQEKVRRVLRQKNAKKEVHVFTFLYSMKDPDAKRFLEEIAQEHNGRFKYVETEE